MTHSARRPLTTLLSLIVAGSFIAVPAASSSRLGAQVKTGAVPRGTAPAGVAGAGVRAPAVPPQNQAIPQNAAAVNRNMRDRMPGANIPLGNFAVGSNGNFPWFLPFAFGYNGLGNYGYGLNNGYGVTGSPAWANTNGYYGVGSGGFGLDNLAGGQSIDGSALAGSTPPVAQELPNSPVADKVQERLRENEALYEFSDVHRMYRATQVARNQEIRQTSIRIAHESAPRLLESSEFNAAKGAIAWPVVLQTNEYSGPRADIERALPSLSGKQGPEAETVIRGAIAEMVATLRFHIETVPADEYVTARKFLDSVEITAHKLVAQ